LMAALVRQGVPLQNVCNGKGTCGKCKVRFLAMVPEPSPGDLKHLSEQDLAKGVRLACAVTPKDGMEIEVSLPDSYDRKEMAFANWEAQEVNPGLQKKFLQIPRPSLEDERGDWDRLVAELDCGESVPSIELDLLAKLPEILRAQNFAVTVTLWSGKVLAVEPGDTTQTMYGVAVDIGTTSVGAALVDLINGKVVKVVSRENGQSSYGADVISRISYAKESLEQRLQLRQAIRETVNNLLEQVVTAVGINPNAIYKMAFVANTTMNHLFLGLDVSHLAVAPYVSSCNSALEFSARDLDLKINPLGAVLIFPNIGSFVGGDTVGAVIGGPEVLAPGNHLLIDLGTNCELLLKTSQQMMACSTAAGPAFEGARINQGMRAKPGAIEGVSIGEDEVSVRVIGGKKAVGICGSGLIEAIDQMRKNGVISQQGTIVDPGRDNSLSPPLLERIRAAEKNGREFVLSFGGDEGEDVYLNQKDIGELQLAKGAVCAGIKTITEMAGISVRELDSVILAGTFATYLNAESILAIGLVPNIDPAKIKIVGNAAHVGAVRALVNQNDFVRAGQLANRVKHIELGGSKAFSYHFMQSMYIEPTD
ncbi:MAG TPA: ASKHA domain-containing protein, partial [Verrucomicrobiae bacterium]|nr:ASKHA domain-containing protein [Verrucomicrobiae bacterium]